MKAATYALQKTDMGEDHRDHRGHRVTDAPYAGGAQDGNGDATEASQGLIPPTAPPAPACPQSAPGWRYRL